jgi:GNAT superfamily N-acetyltransferase
MSEYAIKPLDASTWDAFARLVEKHNGCGFGGCWCTWFHSREGRPEGERAAPGRSVSFARATLMRPSSLMATPRWRGVNTALRTSSRTSTTGRTTRRPVPKLPDYRLTCIFVDRDYRRKGVAGVALRGAIDLIAKAGGGVVEGYPQDTQGKKISAKFLYNTTRSLYEQTGFSYDRPKGKNHCVMRRTVSAAKKPRRAQLG